MLEDLPVGFKALALLGFAAVYAVFLGPETYASIRHHYEKKWEREAEGERIVKRDHDRYFKNLCPDYFEAGLWGQMTTYRDLSWCDDYTEEKIAERAETEKSAARLENARAWDPHKKMWEMMCAGYFEANWWGRFTKYSDMDWCEEFKDQYHAKYG